MGYLFLILILLFLLWPWISPPLGRWFKTFMANRTEDVVRRMMGMPSRRAEKRRRREQERRARRGGPDDRQTRESYYDRRGGTGRRRHRAPSQRAATLMQSVAVDVEYTEIKEFSSDTIFDTKNGQTRQYTEEQVTDAEFTEVRTRR